MYLSKSEIKQIERLRQNTPQERFELMLQLINVQRGAMKAGIRSKNPDITEGEMTQCMKVKMMQIYSSEGRKNYMVSEVLKKILACPVCKGSLQFEETRILCLKCKKAYPIRDGIPVMLIDEAEDISL